MPFIKKVEIRILLIGVIIKISETPTIIIRPVCPIPREKESPSRAKAQKINGAPR